MCLTLKALCMLSGHFYNPIFFYFYNSGFCVGLQFYASLCVYVYVCVCVCVKERDISAQSCTRLCKQKQHANTQEDVVFSAF